MLPLVVLQVHRSLQHLPAVPALELGLLMHHHVHPELGYVGYALAADFALILLVRTVVDDLMFPQLHLVGERLVADGAEPGRVDPQVQGLGVVALFGGMSQLNSLSSVFLIV